MIHDWKSEIVKGVLIQQRIEELDRGRLWQRHLPGVAAGEDEIAATEESLGFSLDPRYREFLLHTNGWRSFLQAVDLFGTSNLLGAHPMDSAVRQLGAIEAADFTADVGLDIADVLPIGASAVQRDMFLLAQPRSPTAGVVVWFSGGTVDGSRASTTSTWRCSTTTGSRSHISRLRRRDDSAPRIVEDGRNQQTRRNVLRCGRTIPISDKGVN